jgi:hypothetical protein
VELVVLRLNPPIRARDDAERTVLTSAIGRDALVEVVLGGQAEKP